MTINKQIIKRNSAKVFSVMKRMCRYSFQELQCCTQLETTELCCQALQAYIYRMQVDLLGTMQCQDNRLSFLNSTFALLIL